MGGQVQRRARFRRAVRRRLMWAWLGPPLGPLPWRWPARRPGRRRFPSRAAQQPSWRRPGPRRPWHPPRPSSLRPPSWPPRGRRRPWPWTPPRPSPAASWPPRGPRGPGPWRRRPFACAAPHWRRSPPRFSSSIRPSVGHFSSFAQQQPPHRACAWPPASRCSPSPPSRRPPWPSWQHRRSFWRRGRPSHPPSGSLGRPRGGRCGSRGARSWGRSRACPAPGPWGWGCGPFRRPGGLSRRPRSCLPP
mmetsp:Transcript_60841/g.108595  ORF Transcript_60841/g.108595 Transcript_60841/m.108595 type:complete len:247 (+) Transcript_60841:31-771(+)